MPIKMFRRQEPQNQTRAVGPLASQFNTVNFYGLSESLQSLLQFFLFAMT